MTPNCTDIVEVESTGGLTCEEILSIYEITISQFYAWNPSVGPDCLGMWSGAYTPTPTRIDNV